MPTTFNQFRPGWLRYLDQFQFRQVAAQKRTEKKPRRMLWQMRGKR